MLQEAAQDAPDDDAVAHPGNAGPQRADRPNHQLNPYASLAGCVERLDDRLVDQVVYLDSNQPKLSVGSMPCLAFDQVDQASSQGMGGDEQALVLRMAGVAGQVVEEAAHLCPEALV